MRERCNCRNSTNYHKYGGRGITVCKEWDSAKAFVEWAFSNGYGDDLTLDRIDNEKGYSPDNCRWITQKEQQNNRRNNRIITCDGESHTLAEWAYLKDIGKSTLWARIEKYKWPIQKAINTPARGRREASF